MCIFFITEKKKHGHKKKKKPKVAKKHKQKEKQSKKGPVQLSKVFFFPNAY